jgi:hypothetical protein
MSDAALGQIGLPQSGCGEKRLNSEMAGRTFMLGEPSFTP